MSFKLYQDKSSTLKKNSRYVQGGTTDIFPNSLGWWEKRTDIAKDQTSDIVITIQKIWDKRPDLLSYYVYGRPDLKWLILMYNNMVDINEEFVTGAQIVVPTAERVFTEIMTNTISYEPG